MSNVKLEKNCTIKWLSWRWFLFERDTIFWSCFLISIVRTFICVGTMAAAVYNQTKFTISIHLLDYFLLLLHSLFLLLFHMNGASERNVIPATKRHWALATPWSSLKIKVYKILSQPRDIWEIVLCFEVILSFSVTIQITAAKQTRLVIHSFKRKGRTLYKWSLEITDWF